MRRKAKTGLKRLEKSGLFFVGKSSSASTDWVDESRMGKREKQQCCALDGRSCAKISLGEDLASPRNIFVRRDADSFSYTAKAVIPL